MMKREPLPDFRIYFTLNPAKKRVDAECYDMRPSTEAGHDKQEPIIRVRRQDGKKPK